MQHISNLNSKKNIKYIFLHFLSLLDTDIDGLVQDCSITIANALELVTDSV